jgi:streptomycin 6-kinase
MSVTQLLQRVEERVRDWSVVVEDKVEKENSVLVFGRRGSLPVVLKVMREQGDEWRSGEVLDAFGGRGTVRVHDYVEGAVLLERLNPGTRLAPLAMRGRDEKATEIIADVIQRMPHIPQFVKAFVTVEDWGKGFSRYLSTDDKQIPRSLVEQGQRMYARLCESQHDARLLHGDLQQYNVLYDNHRGWVAIDPKGVVGEIEYEIGASLRNPNEDRELFASPKIVARRLRRYESMLNINSDRVLKWGFAQAVLAAIWSVEDGFVVDSGKPSIMFANAMQSLLWPRALT